MVFATDWPELRRRWQETLSTAGWPLDRARDREFEVSGMPNKERKGFVDYLLWGLAHAEYNVGYDEDAKIKMMETIRRFASDHLRRLLSD